MYPSSSSLEFSWVYQITVDPNYGQSSPGLNYFNRSGLAEYANIFRCSEDVYRLDDIVPEGWLAGYIFLEASSTSHGYNYWGLGYSDGCRGYKGGLSYVGRLRSQVTHPDNTILSCDTRRPPNTTGLYVGVPGGTYGFCRTDGGVYPRHKRETICNVLWVDGHVSQVRANGSDQVSRVNSLWNSFGGRSTNSCYDSSRP
jgi:prepilin-type processing-associated H-X9-DG protein